jgi:hypothetical protein
MRLKVETTLVVHECENWPGEQESGVMTVRSHPSDANKVVLVIGPTRIVVEASSLQLATLNAVYGAE